MTVFVFQSVPEKKDLRSAISPGKRDTWLATRYRTEMKIGDIVFFWMSGDDRFRGLYGWGRLASKPYMKEDWEAHAVDVVYEQKFGKHVSARAVREDPALAELLIFRAPQATNFLVSDREARRLIKLVAERGELAPPLTEAAS